MSLGFNGRSTYADFVPYIRYTAMGERGGVWSDRDHDDIVFLALCDLEQIRSGWLLFETGYLPIFIGTRCWGSPDPGPVKGTAAGSACGCSFPSPTSVCAS